MSTYYLSIISPQGRAFEGQVNSLVAPGAQGSFGILAKHTPYIATLKSGVLKIVQNGGDKFFALANGVLEVNSKGSVLILSDLAASAKSHEDAEDKIKSASALKK